MNEKERKNNILNILKYENSQLISDRKICLNFIKLILCNKNYVYSTMYKTSYEAAAEHCLRLLGEPIE